MNNKCSVEAKSNKNFTSFVSLYQQHRSKLLSYKLFVLIVVTQAYSILNFHFDTHSEIKDIFGSAAVLLSVPFFSSVRS